MANLDQVTAQIRFGLDQLSSKNAHHEFEHLCRHLTRARICSNILPATGPVSAGGDQGRDFETFRTYLNNSSIADSTFIGLASNKPIAFACTLQDKAGISTKIKSDVKTIMLSGSEIEAVHYFCSADLDVAKRHKIKNAIKEEYDIEIEIHDGQSISELLADREIFWIAEKYLSIPGEIFPRSDQGESDAWYSFAFTKWKNEKPSGNNFSEFAEIKQAARHSLYNEHLRQDLSFWINLIEECFVNSRFDDLKRRAVYETCVLSLRGLNSLSGYEQLLREYFSEILNIKNAASLEDTEGLLAYCITAADKNLIQISAQELSNWRHQLIQRIDENLKDDNHPNVEARLLKIKGWTCMRVDSINPQPPNFNEALEWWLKLADMVEAAPMFPLKQFSDNITALLETILEFNPSAEIPDAYFELTEKIDGLLAKRQGGFTSAASCHKRAVILSEQGHVLDAINFLHRSKFDWYNSETLEEALSIMLFLSMSYMKLGLLFAAKYYALAVAFIAENNSQLPVKRYISIGLMRAATWDYILGAFCSFLNLTEIEIKIHQVHAKNAGELKKNSELHSIVFNLLTLKAISERVNPGFEKLVAERVDSWLPKEWIDKLLPTARQNFQTLTDEEVKTDLVKELLGTPFGDMAPTREVFWSALGIEWKVAWKNDYETTKKAEEFLAILQIYLAEITRHDLCLLKTKIFISIDLTDAEETESYPIPSNKNRFWKINLPRNATHSPTDLGKAHMEVFSSVSLILFEISLLSGEKYSEIMDKLFQKGLASTIFVAQPYEVLYEEFIGAENFNQFERTVEENMFSDMDTTLFEHKELKWNDKIGPTYNSGKSKLHVQNRYNNVLPSIRYTLKRLNKLPLFHETVKRLREKGWLDWHILIAVSGATITERLNQRTKDEFNPERINKVCEELAEEKAEWEPVPTDIFQEEILHYCLLMTMLDTVNLFELECHQSTPDFEAIEHFLRFRYNYWSEDIEHENFFEYKNMNTSA